MTGIAQSRRRARSIAATSPQAPLPRSGFVHRPIRSRFDIQTGHPSTNKSKAIEFAGQIIFRG